MLNEDCGAFIQNGVEVMGVVGFDFIYLLPPPPRSVGPGKCLGDGLDGGLLPAWSSRQREDVLHGAWASQNVLRAAAASDPYP